MKLIEIPASDFDLAMTLGSGQVFHWEKVDMGFVGTMGDVPGYIEQCGDVLKVRCGETPQPARGPGRRGDRSPELSLIISRSIIRSRKSALLFQMTR